MTTPDSPRRRLPFVIAGVVAVLAVLAGLFWFFAIRDTSPDKFSLEEAVDGLDDGSDATTASDDDAELETVEGAWSVASSAGPGGAPSEAGYRVNEELVDIGAKTVVGRTDDVVGALTIEGTTVTEVTMTVDMESIATDSAQRDGRYRAALEVDRFPTSTFTLTEPIELGEVPEPGDHIQVTAVGNLTVHGVTRSVRATLDATLSGSTLVVVGSIPVTFSDYDVEKPSAAIVVSLEDAGEIEFQLYLTKD